MRREVRANRHAGSAKGLQMRSSICVFCSATTGSTAFQELAFATGKLLAQQGRTLVYGGSQHGLMGCCANGALSVGGTVIGVVPRFFASGREMAHEGLSELLWVDGMAERKQLMFERADAFLALPGGFGTLDELFEAITLLQVRVSRKPVALLDAEGYFEGLLTFLQRADRDGYLPARWRQMLLIGDRLESLLERLDVWDPASLLEK